MDSFDTTEGRVVRDANGDHVIDYQCSQFNKFRRITLPGDMIDGIREYLDSLELKWETSGIGQVDDIVPSERSSEHAWIDDEHVTQFMWNNIQSANQDPDWRFDLETIERIQYTKYQPGGHYDVHSDALMTTEEPRMVRKLTAVIVLNDDFEDGKFTFYKIDKGNMSLQDLVLKKGDMIVFPSVAEHRVNAITRGERKTLVAWAWGPLFK